MLRGVPARRRRGKRDVDHCVGAEPGARVAGCVEVNGKSRKVHARPHHANAGSSAGPCSTIADRRRVVVGPGAVIAGEATPIDDVGAGRRRARAAQRRGKRSASRRRASLMKRACRLLLERRAEAGS